MIATLTWKELREHRLIWVAMAMASALSLGALVALVNPPGPAAPGSEKSVLLVFSAFVLSISYALVCASMMLAGETEERTQSFLDTLGKTRWEVWNTKFWSCVGFVTTQCLLVAGCLVMSMEGPEPPPALVVFPAGLLIASLEAVCWGFYFSGHRESVIGAATLTAMCLTAIWILSFVLGGVSPWFLLLRPVAAPVALYLSRRRYCRDEYERGGDEQSALVRRSMLWLSWRQARGTYMFAPLGGIALGVAIAAEFPLWPVLLLGFAVYCGTQVFASDQADQSYRFLGNQRIPPGKAWSTKTLTWLGALVTSEAFAFLMMKLSTGAFTSPHFAHSPYANSAGILLLGSPEMCDLTGPEFFVAAVPLYGFCVGQFFALFVHKSIGAMVISFLVSGLAVSLWLPSMICGGVNPLVPLVSPLILLFGTRVSMWPWLTDRLDGRRAFLGFGGISAAAAAWVAGNLAYRVVALPAAPNPSSIVAFARTIPPPDKNEAGRLFRKAIHDFQAELNALPQHDGGPTMSGGAGAMGSASPGAGGEAPAVPSLSLPPVVESPAMPPAPLPGEGPSGGPMGGGMGAAMGGGSAGGMGAAGVVVLSFTDQLEIVMQEGWSKDHKALGDWLDKLFSRGDWAEDVKEAAALPTGMLDNPLNQTFSDTLEDAQTAQLMGRILVVRSSQWLSKKEPGQALDCLLQALSVSRTLRNHANAMSFLIGQNVESMAIGGLEVWVKAAQKEDKLLGAALKALLTHEENTPPPSDALSASFLILRNMMSSPNSNRPMFPQPPVEGGKGGPTAMLLFSARQVPWEKERWERMMGAFEEYQLRITKKLQTGDPKTGQDMVDYPERVVANLDEDNYVRIYLGQGVNSAFGFGPQLVTRMQKNQERLHALDWRIAGDLYRLEKGKWPTEWQELIPRYLPESFRSAGGPTSFQPEAPKPEETLDKWLYF